jgi:hypothetical protein
VSRVQDVQLVHSGSDADVLEDLRWQQPVGRRGAPSRCSQPAIIAETAEERDRAPLHGNGGKNWGTNSRRDTEEFGMFSLFILYRFYFEALRMCMFFCALNEL